MDTKYESLKNQYLSEVDLKDLISPKDINELKTCKMNYAKTSESMNSITGSRLNVEFHSDFELNLSVPSESLDERMYYSLFAVSFFPLGLSSQENSEPDSRIFDVENDFIKITESKDALSERDYLVAHADELDFSKRFYVITDSST